MRLSIFVILTYSLTFHGCSIFDNENDSPVVSAVIDGEELIIKNNLPYEIYYFAVDQASLPYIFWVPTVSDGNGISPGRYKALEASDIYGDGIPEPVVVYYWDEDISEIFSILIE